MLKLAPRRPVLQILGLLLPWILLSLLASAVAGITSAAERGSAAAPTGVYQLLANPGLEAFDAPYDQFEGVDCQTAAGWQRFSTGLNEPCLMDTRVFAYSHLGGGWVERIEGETSQIIVAAEPYAAGIWQQVTGLEPDAGYGFHAALLTIYQSSAQPPVPDVMIKQVGLDPTGGTDPLAPSVVWSPPSGADKEWDLQRRVSAFAQGPALTAFILIDSPTPAGPWPFLNLSILDSTIVAQTPSIRANSPGLSSDANFMVSWQQVVPAPGGGDLKYRDVQWMDEAEGTWHDWITETYAEEGEFSGEVGHAYRFRARAWQRYPNGAWLASPYRPDGDTRTAVSGACLTGRVFSPRGDPVAGATISISGTSHLAFSGPDGAYTVHVDPDTGPPTVAIDHQRWTAPAPAYDLPLGATETLTVSWSLLPPGDRVTNGGFEGGLDGWFSSGAPVSATVVAHEVHTGRAALALTATTPMTGLAGIGQRVVLTRSWEPVLSYWFRVGAGSDTDRLWIRCTVVTDTLTTWTYSSTLAVDGWQHRWHALTGTGALVTGSATVEFLLSHPVGSTQAVVYLDEVGLGGMPGGPHRSYLPLTFRRH